MNEITVSDYFKDEIKRLENETKKLNQRVDNISQIVRRKYDTTEVEEALSYFSK
jgi:hypothetical protein